MNKINSNIERKFAGQLAEALDHKDADFYAARKIARRINDADLIAACDEIYQNMLQHGQKFSVAMQRQGVFSDEIQQAFEAGEKDGKISQHLKVYLKYRNHELADAAARTVDEVVLLKQLERQSTASILNSLSDIAARQQVNQNLLTRLIAVGSSMSESEIEALKTENSDSYKSYRKTFLDAYAKTLEKHQEFFSKNDGEDSDSV